MKISDIKQKSTLIFDVDGTLYSQPKMRFRMAMSLLGYYFLHFWRLSELLVIYHFRRVRELEEFRTSSFEEQVLHVADKMGKSTERVCEIVEHWIMKKPLDIIKRCSFSRLIDFISERAREGVKIFIYSDYPAEDKLEALGVIFDKVFTPDMPEIGELKPSRCAMSYILSVIDTSAQDILYVGDRDEKDGASARLSGIDYLDIYKLLKLIK